MRVGSADCRGKKWDKEIGATLLLRKRHWHLSSSERLLSKPRLCYLAARAFRPHFLSLPLSLCFSFLLHHFHFNNPFPSFSGSASAISFTNCQILIQNPPFPSDTHNVLYFVLLALFVFPTLHCERLQSNLTGKILY